MGREYRAQSHHTGSLNLRFSQSPNDALIDIKVWSGLRQHIPIRLAFDTHVDLRITVISQRLVWRMQIRDTYVGNRV